LALATLTGETGNRLRIGFQLYKIWNFWCLPAAGASDGILFLLPHQPGRTTAPKKNRHG